MSQTHRVALLGFGTVGKGFAEIVQQKAALLSRQLGLNVKIVAVSDFKKGSIYAPDGLDIPVRRDEVIGVRWK
jgi:homoserine dehydrogenase